MLARFFAALACVVGAVMIVAVTVAASDLVRQNDNHCISATATIVANNRYNDTVRQWNSILRDRNTSLARFRVLQSKRVAAIAHADSLRRETIATSHAIDSVTACVQVPK